MQLKQKDFSSIVLVDSEVTDDQENKRTHPFLLFKIPSLHINMQNLTLKGTIKATLSLLFYSY